jgi:hypothetical protein
VEFLCILTFFLIFFFFLIYEVTMSILESNEKIWYFSMHASCFYIDVIAAAKCEDGFDELK